VPAAEIPISSTYSRLWRIRNPVSLSVLTARSGTKLSRLVARYRYVNYSELVPPSGNDGFLATNSLLAFCVALTRAYGALEISPPPLPADFSRLIGGKRKIAAWRKLCDPLWEKQTLVVLYPPSLLAAASDVESKFTEAAIGNVQIAITAISRTVVITGWPNTAMPPVCSRSLRLRSSTSPNARFGCCLRLFRSLTLSFPMIGWRTTLVRVMKAGDARDNANSGEHN
jgi:hypothetical protein